MCSFFRLSFCHGLSTAASPPLAEKGASRLQAHLRITRSLKKISKSVFGCTCVLPSSCYIQTHNEVYTTRRRVYWQSHSNHFFLEFPVGHVASLYQRVA